MMINNVLIGKKILIDYLIKKKDKEFMKKETDNKLFNHQLTRFSVKIVLVQDLVDKKNKLIGEDKNNKDKENLKKEEDNNKDKKNIDIDLNIFTYLF
jgi:hypothetical protein